MKAEKRDKLFPHKNLVKININLRNYGNRHEKNDKFYAKHPKQKYKNSFKNIGNSKEKKYYSPKLEKNFGERKNIIIKLGEKNNSSYIFESQNNSNLYKINNNNKLKKSNNNDELLLFNNNYYDKLNNIKNIFKEQHFCNDHRSKDKQYKQCKELFISYCMDCKKDLCFICENEHNGHNFERYKLIKTEELNEIIVEIKKFKDSILKKIDQMKKILNNFKDKFEFDYKLNKEIIDSYSLHNRNFQILEIVNKIYTNKSIFDDVKKVAENFEYIFHKFNEEISNIYNNRLRVDNNNMNVKCGGVLKDSFYNTNKSLEIMPCNKIINCKQINLEEEIKKCYSKIKNLSEYIKNNSNINYKAIGESMCNDIKNVLQNINEQIDKKVNLKLEGSMNDGKVNNDNFQIVSLKDNRNEIKVNYKFSEIDKKSGYVKIFGRRFVNNNKNTNCYFIYNYRKYYLSEYLEIGKEEEIDNDLQIKILGIEEITNLSYMFYECTSLFSVIDFNNFKTTDVTDMSYMFYGCSSLEILKDISDLETINVRDMSYIFYGCKHLSYIPDISKWKTMNVSDMSFMFYDCSSLDKLPDIAKWKTDNVNDMHGMFCNCEKLSDVPEISNWNIENVYNLSHLFSGCKSLISLPDISNWNLSNVRDLRNIFKNCELIECLPDFSKWDITHVKKMNSLFEGCKNLKEKPKISEWNVENVTDISGLFRNCISLTEISDISKWNTKNIENMSYLFSNCQNLSDLPNISKWNFNKAKDISYLFENCINLYKYEHFREWNIENKRKNGKFVISPKFLANLYKDS